MTTLLGRENLSLSRGRGELTAVFCCIQLRYGLIFDAGRWMASASAKWVGSQLGSDGVTRSSPSDSDDAGGQVVKKGLSDESPRDGDVAIGVPPQIRERPWGHTLCAHSYKSVPVGSPEVTGVTVAGGPGARSPGAWPRR